MLLIHTYFSLLKSIFTPFVSFFHWGSSMVLWIRSIPLCCLLKKKSVLSQWEIFLKNGKILIYLFDFYLVCPMELQCVLHFKELIYLFLIIFKAKIQMDENRKKKKLPKNEYDVRKGIPRMFHTYLKLLLLRVTLLMLPSGHFLQLCVEFSFENIEEACTEQCQTWLQDSS